MEVTQEEIRVAFDYDQKRGELLWRYSSGGRKRGSVAGCIQNVRTKRETRAPKLYRVVRFRGKLHLAHRLIWMLHNGPIPAGHQIDHINRNSLDNRLGNLRAVTASENNRNKGLLSRNKSGCAGVYWHHECKKWAAEIFPDKRKVYLGVFRRKADAIAARKEAERRFNYLPKAF